MAVFMPMTWPREFSSGPPELPGFTAASVWMIPLIIRPFLARLVRRAVKEGDLDRVGPLDDVKVRQDVPLAIDDEARPRAAGRLLVAEEPDRHRGRRDVDDAAVDRGVDADVDLLVGVGLLEHV